jgi:hypothetical protein
VSDGCSQSVEMWREEYVTFTQACSRELRPPVLLRGKPYFECGNDDRHYYEPDHPYDGYCRKLHNR